MEKEQRTRIAACLPETCAHRKPQRKGGKSAAHRSKGERHAEKSFVETLGEQCVTPNVAQKQNSAIDGRTTKQRGYAKSRRKRKRVEEVFGWMNDFALQ